MQSQCLSSIVVTALQNHDTLVVSRPLHAVNQAVLLRDPPRPVPLERPFQRLRFTETLERRSPNGLNDLVDALEGVSVVRSPVEIVFPTVIGEMDSHAMVSTDPSGLSNGRSCVVPARAWATDARSRAALVGLLRR